MKLLNHITMLETIAKALGKPCMRISSWDACMDLHGCTWDDVYLAAPYLDKDDHDTAQALSDGDAILVFDSDEEMEKYYQMTVGDDGPTKLNPYDGKMRVYAITCGADGELRNENT